MALHEKTVRARVVSIEHVGRLVVKLNLSPTDSPFLYREGQYLSVALPGTGERRSYSMASPCTSDASVELLELHIRLHEHGVFSRMLREQIEVGSALTLSGPYGNCVWNVPAESASTVILLATGTGIAPLKAMVERHVPDSLSDVWLYWGGDSLDDLYASSEFLAIERKYPHFHFVPVLRSTQPEWTGARGFVQDVAAAAHPDLRNAHVFACGSPSMVRMARSLLSSGNGLPDDRFYFDAFEPSQGAQSPPPAIGQTVAVFASLSDGTTQPVRCDVGQSLMLPLVSHGLVSAICGGNQSCGTCRVTLAESDFARLSELSRSEKRLLQALPDSGPFDRLACQIEVSSSLADLHVTIPASEF